MAMECYSMALLVRILNPPDLRDLRRLPLPLQPSLLHQGRVLLAVL